jgi:hypothetical protein
MLSEGRKTKGRMDVIVNDAGNVHDHTRLDWSDKGSHENAEARRNCLFNWRRVVTSSSGVTHVVHFPGQSGITSVWPITETMTITRIWNGGDHRSFEYAKTERNGILRWSCIATCSNGVTHVVNGPRQLDIASVGPLPSTTAATRCKIFARKWRHIRTLEDAEAIWNRFIQRLWIIAWSVVITHIVKGTGDIIIAPIGPFTKTIMLTWRRAVEIWVQRNFCRFYFRGEGNR